MSFTYCLDLLGTSVFAVSGAMAALHKRMHHDMFGIAFTGFITAVGGGTLRDVIIGAQPLAWVADANYLITILASVGLAVLLRRLWEGTLRRPLLFFDTLGVGLYTILGQQKALEAGVNAWAAVLLGMISAIFGGVLRDVLLAEQPVIFSKELYATPCLAGAIFYATALPLGLPPTLSLLIGVLIITGLRLAAIRFKWSLPEIK